MADGTALLAALGSTGWRVMPRSGAPAADPSTSFDDLLAKAQAGLVRSGRPVEAAAGATIDAGALRGAEDLADLAEARGITHAALVHEGRVMRLDVAARRIAPLDAPDRVAAGINGVVLLDEPPQAEPASPRGTGP